MLLCEGREVWICKENDNGRMDEWMNGRGCRRNPRSLCGTTPPIRTRPRTFVRPPLPLVLFPVPVISRSLPFTVRPLVVHLTMPRHTNADHYFTPAFALLSPHLTPACTTITTDQTIYHYATAHLIAIPDSQFTPSFICTDHGPRSPAYLWTGLALFFFRMYRRRTRTVHSHRLHFRFTFPVPCSSSPFSVLVHRSLCAFSPEFLFS